MDPETKQPHFAVPSITRLLAIQHRRCHQLGDVMDCDLRQPVLPTLPRSKLRMQDRRRCTRTRRNDSMLSSCVPPHRRQKAVHDLSRYGDLESCGRTEEVNRVIGGRARFVLVRVFRLPESADTNLIYGEASWECVAFRNECADKFHGLALFPLSLISTHRLRRLLWGKGSVVADSSEEGLAARFNCRENFGRMKA